MLRFAIKRFTKTEKNCKLGMFQSFIKRNQIGRNFSQSWLNKKHLFAITLTQNSVKTKEQRNKFFKNKKGIADSSTDRVNTMPDSSPHRK